MTNPVDVAEIVRQSRAVCERAVQLRSQSHVLVVAGQRRCDQVRLALAQVPVPPLRGLTVTPER